MVFYCDKWESAETKERFLWVNSHYVGRCNTGILHDRLEYGVDE